MNHSIWNTRRKTKLFSSLFSISRKGIFRTETFLALGRDFRNESRIFLFLSFFLSSFLSDFLCLLYFFPCSKDWDSLCTCCYPTDPFTTLELKNPLNDVLELHKIRRSPDLWALKFRKVRSGCTKQKENANLFKTEGSPFFFFFSLSLYYVLLLLRGLKIFHQVPFSILFPSSTEMS